MVEAITITDFLEDVKEHELYIRLDDGDNRSLAFHKKDPASGALSKDMQFTITTWFEHLCISGDMGTFVFELVPDMFELFRGISEFSSPTYKPEFDYWAEKLTAVDVCGYTEFDIKTHRQDVRYFWKRIHQTQGTPSEEVTDYIERLENVSNEQELTEALALFPKYSKDKVAYDKLRHSPETYTKEYLWCCHAIPWAIEQYDNFKKENSDHMPESLELVIDNKKALSINVAKDFSPYLFGRTTPQDGDFTGEVFRETILKKNLDQLNDGEILIVDFDDVLTDVGSSFLSEAFAGLIEKGHITKENLLNVLVIKSKDDLYDIAVRKYINEAELKKENQDG